MVYTNVCVCVPAVGKGIEAYIWDLLCKFKKRMWFSCGFHVVFLLWDAQRTDSAHPGQLVIRFSHMSEAPTNIYPQDMGTLLHLKTQ